MQIGLKWMQMELKCIKWNKNTKMSLRARGPPQTVGTQGMKHHITCTALRQKGLERHGAITISLNIALTANSREDPISRNFLCNLHHYFVLFTLYSIGGLCKLSSIDSKDDYGLR